LKTSLLFILSFLFALSGEFKSSQLKYPRVRETYSEKEAALRKEYKEHGFNFEKQNVFIRVFKEEEELELWIKNSKNTYTLFKTYPICSASGRLGPKRKIGDNQVPEGFYHIDRFNPQSNFYLSLGLNYPNASDKILSDKKNPGGDIFIHGNCVSIGCMAMTDDKIKEIYLITVEAKNAGQAIIPVNIFPFRMTEKNMFNARAAYGENKFLIEFWENLKMGFDYFEKMKKLPTVSVNNNGKYVFR
jgi:murein L,D-transpeptidase YafK